MGRSLGLLCDAEWAQFTSRRDAIESWRQKLAATYFYPCEETNAWFARRGLSALKDRVSADALLKRPEMDWGALVELGIEGGDAVRADVREQVETQVKYAGYIQRDLDTLEGVRKSDTLVIPDALDFDRVPGLSAEIRGRLKAVRPETIGQASRLMGITPAAVATLMIHIKMRANGHA